MTSTQQTDTITKHDTCCAHAAIPIAAGSSSSSSVPAPSPASTTAAATVSCSNCDDPINPLFAFACADCDEDLTPTCAACCQSLHRPVRTRRHRLTRLSDRLITQAQNAENPSVVQRGFCANCKQMGKPALQIPLADLECESCSLGEPAATPSGLCLDCDVSLHQSLDNDNHVRLVFDDDDDEDATSPTSLQSELFALAGVEGLRILHQDSMPSYAGRIWPGSMMLARYLEQMNRDNPECFREKNVIELGCGCAAIPALTCWLLGAWQLWCTDMNTDGLKMLDQNVKLILQQLRERNATLPAVDENASYRDEAGDQIPDLESIPSCAHGCDCHSKQPVTLRKRRGMHTHELAFGGDVQPFSKLLPFDYILGSYILYDPDSFEPLSRTLDALVPRDANTQILLTSHEPTREGMFLTLLEEKGFTWKRIPFSLQSAQLSDEGHTEVAHSNIGTGLRSTSIIAVTRKAQSQPSSSTSTDSSSSNAEANN